MMMNIFSIFDPSTSMLLSLNWLSIFLIFFYLPYQYWMMHSQINYLWYMILDFMYKEFKILINYSLSNLIMFISLFTMIFFNNFLGLFPYIYTASSHMSFCSSLSISMWLSMMIYMIFNYMNDLFSHLTPQGTPLLLMPFMVIIETISLIIRPLTLSVRLMANMMAGHLLISLLGSSFMLTNSLSLIFLMTMTQLMLFILEISVSIIQAYVFSILTTLYTSEL